MTIDPNFTDTVIIAGRRRRTEQRVHATVAAVASILLLVSVAVNGPKLFDRGIPPTTTNGLGDAKSVSDWLDGLKPSIDRRVAYVEGQTLHVGQRSLDLTGPGITGLTEVQLRAPVVGGWIANVYRTSYDVAVVHPDGRVRPLGPYHGNSDVIEVSPDGTQAVIGDPAAAVIDVRSGGVVATPPRKATPVIWLDRGIYLTRARGGAFIWQPGASLTRAPGTCAFEASTVITISTGARRCSRFLSMSPDRRYGLTTNGIVNRATGLTTFIRGYPGGAYEDYPAPYDWHFARWEDNEHVVIAVFVRTDNGTPTTSLVRCNAASGSCERISKPIVTRGPEETTGFVLTP